MAFGPGASVRTSGWTFHTLRDAPTSETPAARVTPSRRIPAPRAILDLIATTSERHARNEVLSALDLTSHDWQVLFRALIEAESSYRPTATSPKGAYGLGQLMPATASALGVDPRDVAQNLDGAARYLLAQLARFGEIDLALAAYNAGPHRVIEYRGVPPFAETRSYITRVHRIRARLSGQATEKPSIRMSTRGPKRPDVVLDLN